MPDETKERSLTNCKRGRRGANHRDMGALHKIRCGGAYLPLIVNIWLGGSITYKVIKPVLKYLDDLNYGGVMTVLASTKVCRIFWPKTI